MNYVYIINVIDCDDDYIIFLDIVTTITPCLMSVKLLYNHYITLDMTTPFQFCNLCIIILVLEAAICVSCDHM